MKWLQGSYWWFCLDSAGSSLSPKDTTIAYASSIVGTQLLPLHQTQTTTLLCRQNDGPERPRLWLLWDMVPSSLAWRCAWNRGSGPQSKCRCLSGSCASSLCYWWRIVSWPCRSMGVAQTRSLARVPTLQGASPPVGSEKPKGKKNRPWKEGSQGLPCPTPTPRTPSRESFFPIDPNRNKPIWDHYSIEENLRIRKDFGDNLIQSLNTGPLLCHWSFCWEYCPVIKRSPSSLCWLKTSQESLGYIMSLKHQLHVKTIPVFQTSGLRGLGFSPISALMWWE